VGNKSIAGVETVGRCETNTIDVGVMGNDQSLTATSETWHSHELGVNLLSIPPAR
jgi:hypothetical protein